MDTLTLAGLFTAAGAVAAAAVVRQFVQLVKFAIPAIGDKVSGALQAFVVSAALYVLAFASVGPFTPDGVFLAALSWLGCAVAAVGIDAALGHVTGSDERKVTERIGAAYNAGHADGFQTASAGGSGA